MRKKMKHRAIAMIAVIVSLVLSTGTPNFAQSVADAARQERERKRQLALHAVHVYTNEDLSKPHILVPEDEARIAGRVDEPVGAETAVNAEPPAPVAPLVVMPAQAPAPDIADFATEVSLPEAAKPATNVVLPASDSNSAPPLATHHARNDASAPSVAAQAQVPAAIGEIKIPSTTMPFAAADAYGPASLALPVSVSKPLVREAGSRLQTQPVPLAVININTPSATLPFATAEAYNPAKPALPAVVSKPILKTQGNRAQTLVAVPMVAGNSPASTIPVATNAGPAGIMIPATVSKPLMKDASNRMIETQAPVPVNSPVIGAPAAAMPFATTAAYGPAKVGMPPPVAPAVAREMKRNSNREIAAPAVSYLAPASPVRVTLTEHTIVRPAEPVTQRSESTCSAPCDGKLKTSPIAPAAVLVRADAHSDIAKIPPSPASVPETLGTRSPESVVEGSTEKLKIQPGDSLWKLAQRYFGSGSRWKRLAALNPQLANPSRILVGEWIHVPAEHKQHAHQVVIQPGDTLWKVAQTALGSPVALNCIAQANPQIQSVNLVRAGETLTVPTACGDQDKAQN
jgi:nucleoid-associated protein YgaU